MKKGFKPGMGGGDLGFTDLFGGKRTPKTDRRIKLNALIDELSALLGLLKTGIKDKRAKESILTAQQGLVRTAAAVSGMKTDLGSQTLAIEELIKALAGLIRTPKKFILPGANETEALVHIARTRARICEIMAWEIKAKAPAVYLNRLSDFLFLLALKCAVTAPSGQKK